MYAEVPVNSRATNADENAKIPRRPTRSLGSTDEAEKIMKEIIYRVMLQRCMHIFLFICILCMYVFIKYAKHNKEKVSKILTF